MGPSQANLPFVTVVNWYLEPLDGLINFRTFSASTVAIGSFLDPLASQ
jgi:hypothetical protein